MKHNNCRWSSILLSSMNSGIARSQARNNNRNWWSDPASTPMLRLGWRLNYESGNSGETLRNESGGLKATRWLGKRGSPYVIWWRLTPSTNQKQPTYQRWQFRPPNYYSSLFVLFIGSWLGVPGTGYSWFFLRNRKEDRLGLGNTARLPSQFMIDLLVPYRVYTRVDVIILGATDFHFPPSLCPPLNLTLNIFSLYMPWRASKVAQPALCTSSP